ncbi:MAG: hypothetical protein RI897_3214 [Verrucomicrobiota bacterium]
MIVNADDFGRSGSINRAVWEAHERGILTTASLMVGGEAWCEAVEMAREFGGHLGVGLHLTLVCGRAVSVGGRGLVDGAGYFSESAAGAGWRYFWDGDLREEVRREVVGQFERFRSTGLALDHVNGHLHFHLHPVVLRVLVECSKEYGVRGVRLPRDPLGLSLGLARGRWGYRLGHAAVFWLLNRWAGGWFRRAGWVWTDAVYGLLQDSRVDERYVLGLLGRLGQGDYELYAHPSMGRFRHELEALVSPRVREVVRERGVRLIRYVDL